MDPEEVQGAANEAASAMGPLAQVVAAYYHQLRERGIPDRLMEKLTRDFMWFYLTDDGGGVDDEE